jgi:hypothetical protein
MYDWYAGAFRQLATSLMGWSCLWIFISPLRDGADGFMFVYLHLLSLVIKVGLCVMVFLTWDWNVFVRSVATVWKLWSLKKFSILLS